MRFLYLIFFTYFLQSCAFFIESNYQDIKISSIPNGADVYVGSEKIGVTPFTWKLQKTKWFNKAKSSYKLVFIKKGYHKNLLYIHGTRDAHMSKICTFDVTFGWLPFGVWQRMAKSSKRCNYFDRDNVFIKLRKMQSGEYQIGRSIY
jgi:hypothetical protein